MIKPPGFVRRLYATDYMVKPEMQRGEIPSTKEAYSQSLNIAAPAVAEMVSIALMSMLDMIMVGALGEEAVAAIGLTGQPRMIFFSVFFALNIAVTAIVARNKGAGDDAAARSCLRMSMMMVVVGGTMLSILAVVLARPMMLLAGARYDTIGLATSYFRITGYGLVFAIMSNVICAAQRASGNTKITMQVNVVANVVKVIFNFLLIAGRFGFPELGVDGAAISLVIAHVISCALALQSLFRKGAYLRISRKDSWRPDMPMVKTIGRVTAGGMLEQLFMRVGFFAYARVIAGLGTLETAAHFIAMQFMNLSFTFADGIGVATTALVGQNLGKKRPDLSIMYGKIGTRLAWLIAALLSTTAFLTRFHFPAMFAIGGNPEVVQITAGIMLIIVYILPFQTAQIVMAGSLRGAGDTKYVAFTMLITVALIRPITGFVLTYPMGWGLTGAWIAIIIDQGVRLTLLLTRFTRGRWINTQL
ncbi:MAG: MATE family efflux transporter [Defluviitaleaceae bacterium]|nr:MATE family efflux transporter [Defluviitaleaceae bacterium]